VVVHQATFSCGAGLPSWLNEGPLHSDYRIALDAALIQESVFSVSGLGGDFPYARQDVYVVYAQSWSLETHPTVTPRLRALPTIEPYAPPSGPSAEGEPTSNAYSDPYSDGYRRYGANDDLHSHRPSHGRGRPRL